MAGRPVPAQTPAPVPPQQSETPAPLTLKAGSLDVTVIWRARAEAWHWFEGNVGNSSYLFGHSQLRLGVGHENDHIAWFVEAEQVAILGLPDDAVAPAPLGQLGLGGTYYAANGNRQNVGSLFAKQAFVRFKRLGQTSLKVGRFEFFDGAEAKSADPTLTTLIQTRIAHRLISNFGFSAVQRTFDGAEFQWNANSNNVTAFAARATEGVFQADGMSELDVQVYYGAYNKSIKTRRGAASLRVFGVGYVDDRANVLKTDNRSAAARLADHGNISIGTWGADYIQVIHTENGGTFDALGWGVLQTGAWGSLTQRANAFVGEVGWQGPTSTLKPWLSAGFSHGSGDGDPKDATHGTFVQLLTTPRQYARFPFYNMMNNDDAYATFTIRPVPKLALRTELHRLWLADAADLWYLGGGAFQSTSFGYQGRPSYGLRNLATVADVSADHPVTRFLTATLYYAHAWGEGPISAIYPRRDSGQLVYVETTVHY
jgi:hypothetical protein